MFTIAMRHRLRFLLSTGAASPAAEPQHVPYAPQTSSELPQPSCKTGVACPWWTVAVIGLVLGCITLSVFIQKGGWLHGEADLYLVDHNASDRSFLSKIVSPHITDASFYQARELSHVLEFLDAQFIRWCTDRRLPHFYSITNFVILLAISLLQWRFATKYLRLDPLVTLLLLALFWTTPCILFSGLYVRASKQGAALLLFILGCRVARQIAFRGEPAPPRVTNALIWVKTFLLALALCFMDRQGFFFAGAIFLSLALLAIPWRAPGSLNLLTALMAALITHTAYNRYVGPIVVEKLTGFEVSFHYQQLPFDTLLEHARLCFSYGWELLVNSFRFYLANLPAGLVAFIWVALFFLFYSSKPQSLSQTNNPTAGFQSSRFNCRFASRRLLRFLDPIRLGCLLFLWIGLMVLMNALMVLRHPPLIWPDHRSLYYWIPTTTVIFFAVTFALHRFTWRFPVRPWLLRLALVAAVLSNIGKLPEHYRITREGHFSGFMNRAPELLSALKQLSSFPAADSSSPTAFDTRTVSRLEGFDKMLKNPLSKPPPTRDEFVNSSVFYNFMRSRRNLPADHNRSMSQNAPDEATVLTMDHDK